MLKLFAFALVGLALAGTASAQEAKAPTVDVHVGSWVLKGPGYSFRIDIRKGQKGGLVGLVHPHRDHDKRTAPPMRETAISDKGGLKFQYRNCDNSSNRGVEGCYTGCPRQLTALLHRQADGSYKGTVSGPSSKKGLTCAADPPGSFKEDVMMTRLPSS